MLILQSIVSFASNRGVKTKCLGKSSPCWILHMFQSTSRRLERKDVTYRIKYCGLEGCPVKLKTDCGTENGVMAAMQCTFQQDVEAHKYGSSPMNQRIEGWGSLSEAYTLTLGNGDLSVYRPMNGEEFGD
ncbi:uncharacterized protein [Pocillopora verrucosa]|uniref:uncharacterized protein n=1 Tax=Pocillopora verrucosa TaxID=203993 RepID=UPI00333F5DC1